MLHLMRHGAPERPGLMMGRTDGLPTAAGIAVCAGKAVDLGVKHLVASDLRRCRHAGDAISAVLGLPLMIDPRWRELDFGDWDGKAADTIDAQALGRFWDDPDAAAPPGGERWSSLVARIAKALGELAPRPTLVVTHGGAIRAVLHKLCGFEQRQLWAFDLPYGALVSLRVWPGEWPSAQIAGILP